MAYNRRGRKNKEEHQKKVIIRCKFHQKPVFDTDTCANFKAKSEANTGKLCRNCQHAY